MSEILSLDVESRSTVDLKKAGAWRYFDDPSADILCAAYVLGDGEVQLWRRGDPPPAVWQEHVRNGGIVSGHNSWFERLALLHVLGPKYGWAVPAVAQFRDTMAQCAAMSIPQSLDQAAQAMGLEIQKDKDGQRLIRKFCVPRRPRKGEPPHAICWNNEDSDPEDFAKLCLYCKRDVEVERELRKTLVPLSPAEQEVWELTVQMNTRGVQLDMDLVRAMLQITDKAKKDLDREMAVATNWEVTACSQVSQLTAWLQRQGVPADKVNKNAIEDLLASELPEAARRAVELRKEAAKTSTAKLDAMLKCVARDGRVRGLHLYHGASTGRWSGRLVQTQNMPRGTGTVKDPDTARRYMLKGDADLVDILYGSPMSAVSDMLRSCLVASPGHRLLAADYSAIEGRVTAWTAGEAAELDAYRANDAGVGAGIYEIAAGGIFNTDPFKVSKQQRQVGKAACVAEGTWVLVCSDAGQIAYKPIQYVSVADLVWDGIEWVRHAGVVCNGEQECLDLTGMKLTPDHLIWCGPSVGWMEAGQVASSASMTSQASGTAKACWPSQATWFPETAGSEHSWCNATAVAQSIGSRSTTSTKAGSFGATLAPKSRLPSHARNSTCIMQRSARTKNTAVASLTGWLRSTTAVKTPMRSSTQPTEGVGYYVGGRKPTASSVTEMRAAPDDSGQANGATRCSSISSICPGGTTLRLNSTGSTTTKGTRPAIFASATEEPIRSTSGKSTSCRPGSSNSKPKLRVYDLVNAGPRRRFTIFSSSGPLIVHNCLALGFGGGVLAFNSMASIYNIDMAPVFPVLREVTDPETWDHAVQRYEECCERKDTGTDVMSREAWIASEVTKVQWRARHPSTVALWAGLDNAAREAVQTAGTISSYGPISYIVKRGFLWCRLPSGRCLAYGAPKVQEREVPWGGTRPSVTALGVNSVTKKWERFALYGGLLTENCLSGSSEVLTECGWRRIDTVDTSMRVWDGLAFVSHDGLLPRGAQETINFGGLWLTPDHEVLTFDGWKHAGELDPEKTPSPITGLDGAPFWSFGRDGIRGVEWVQEPVDHQVRLWDYADTRRIGTSERADEQLRVFARRAAVGARLDASDDQAPGLRSLAVHVGQMSSADSPRLGELRRARHLGLRAVELVRKLLGRHGAQLHVGFDDRQERQRSWVHAGELPLDHVSGEHAQPEKQPHNPNAHRSDAALRSRRGERGQQDDAVLPAPSGLARGEDVRHSGRDEPRVEPVYDLLNCGPRHRFVARGPGGRPFIVHNCVQAIARDLMAHGMLQAERAGYPMVMTVHDEGVADVPEGFGSLKEFEGLLCALPTWATGLPVVASGYEALSYRKD